MGYRTDVAFVVRSGIKVPKFEEIEDCFDKVINNDTEDTLYVAECIKWYSDTKVVIAVEEFLDTLNHDDYMWIELDTNQGSGGVDIRGNYDDNEYGLGYICKLDYNAD